MVMSPDVGFSNHVFNFRTEEPHITVRALGSCISHIPNVLMMFDYN